jgi:hypothetical protein
MLRWHLPRRSIPALVVPVLIALAFPRPAAADVNSYRAVPAAFSPNADGRRDLTTLKWNLTGATADTIVIAIRNFIAPTDSPPLRTFKLLARPVGRDSVAWDGRDDFGALVPDTIYSARLFQRNAVGDTIASGQVAIELDTVAPLVPVFNGPADTTVADTLYDVSGIAAGADTLILFRGGVPIDTVAVSGKPPTFSFTFVLVEGENLFAVQSYDHAYNLSAQTTAIDVHYLNTPGLGPAKAVPVFFSPNGDGVLDSTRCGVSLDALTARLLVELRQGPVPGVANDTSFPVAVLHDAPSLAGPLSFVWDGRDSVGAIVPDGPYFFRVTAESLSTAGAPIPPLAPRTAAISLDNTAPVAPIPASPLPDASERSTVVVQVQTEQTDSLFVWRNGILVSRTQTGSGTRISSISVKLSPGDNDLTFQGRDFAGNQSPVGGPYRIRYETPIGFHAPERFGHGDAFLVNFETPPRSIVIDLFTLKGQPVRRLFSNQGLLRYELPWDLNDENGHGVGDGPYIARLTVTFVDGSVQETKGAIVVVK